MIPTLYEPFRHWSDGGSVYILSDLHFDDADCKFMSPDWISPQEQISIINGMYTHISFDDAEEELKRMEEFRKAQAEIEKKNDAKAISQKMFKVV